MDLILTDYLNEMEILSEIIQTTLNSFDFAYCIVVNILTYLIIRLIDDKRKQHLTTWQKRVVLLITLSSTGVLYILFGTDLRLLLNSAILTPVFWSWIIKPICKAFNIDYKEVDIFK